MRRLWNLIYAWYAGKLDVKGRAKFDADLASQAEWDADRVPAGAKKVPAWWQGEEAAAREAAEVHKFMASRGRR